MSPTNLASSHSFSYNCKRKDPRSLHRPSSARLLTLFLSPPPSAFILQDGLRSGPLSSVVVEAVEPTADPAGLATVCDSCCSCSCCAFFCLTSCSADLRASRVTPCVERLVSRTRLACALRCVSDSSSRTGGTKDLEGGGTKF